jgi:hypothetical protein
VYVVEHVSPERPTPLTDGVPVIVGTGEPKSIVDEEAVTVNELPATTSTKV